MKILLVNNERDINDLGSIENTKNNVLKVVDADFVVKHYTEIYDKEDDDHTVDFIILSGRHNSNWETDEMPLFKGEYNLIRSCRVPLLGICAGFQLMGLAYGVRMDYLSTAEKEKYKEYGYLKVNLLAYDKIFAGLSSPIIVYQNHYCELKDIPPGFINLAASDITRIQCVKHISRNIYGVQFHPEMFNGDYGDGKVILKNFFSIT
ncbi:MAG: gamma-glutamyl-gamma-aminobutyrate hydrolase family protein [Clostridia bacterium]|nr:gamma-glutamyl-gamma-aminobutyrate hydrolase family protein [Clostridia bacterium]